MIERPARTSTNGSSSELPENLTERVQARVAEAAFALDRRATATRPKSHRRRATLATSAGDSARSPEEALAEQSLRRVFRDLGTSYRRFRKQTGDSAHPRSPRCRLQLPGGTQPHHPGGRRGFPGRARSSDLK